MSAIIRRYKAKEVVEGGGIIVNRAFGYHETNIFDPFLMLDYFVEDQVVDSPGVPWHPHKGIETISYLLKGNIVHEDSMGNRGELGPGELQWMSAGRGILHQEMMGDSPVDGMQGFQFWLNLAAKDKLKEPDYKYIHNGEMKVIEEEGSIVRVIAGSYQGQSGPIDKSELGVEMMHMTIEAGHSINLDRQVGKNGFIFVFEGQGLIDDSDSINEKSAYILGEGEIKMTAKDSRLEVIFAQGIPLNEPIAWYGPIVMNTQEELEEAFDDLNNDNFVK